VELWLASASELNPGEGLWAHLKEGELQTVYVFNLSHLRSGLRDAEGQHGGTGRVDKPSRGLAS
jgi:hypothetical protein